MKLGLDENANEGGKDVRMALVMTHFETCLNHSAFMHDPPVMAVRLILPSKPAF